MNIGIRLKVKVEAVFAITLRVELGLGQVLG